MHLGAVGVPAGEVGVLSFLGWCNGVGLPVKSPILPVHIAEEVHVEEGVIEGRVEDPPLALGSAGDPNAREGLSPSGPGPVSELRMRRNAGSPEGKVILADPVRGVAVSSVLIPFRNRSW